MALRHGVYTQESPTPLQPPVRVDSAIPCAFGAAPVHRLDKPLEAVNKPLIAFNYADCVQLAGYSDDWAQFTLCEVMYAQFRIFAIAPLILVNIWNPLEGAQNIAKSLNVRNGMAEITDPMAIKSTLEVMAGELESELGTDYRLEYRGDTLRIIAIPGGNITEAITSLAVTYQQAQPVALTANDYIGGIDAHGTRTGFELADEVFLRYQRNIGFLLAPGAPDSIELNVAMTSRAKNLNSGNFEAIALIDLPTTGDNANFRELPAYKNSNSLVDPYQFLNWPCASLGERVFHASTLLAGLHGRTDAESDGTPYVSSSNQHLPITGVCDRDGNEFPVLDQSQANFLGGNGIGTFLNWDGWTAWGNTTAAFPNNTDVKDNRRYIRRMFIWIKNTTNRSMWRNVDAPVNKILIDGVLLSTNEWLNSLTARGALLGGRVEFLREDNPNIDLMQGRIFFRVHITPPMAAEEIVFDFSFDPNYLETLFE